VLRKLSLCLLFASLLACGGDSAVQPSSTDAPIGKVALTETVTAEPASKAATAKTPSASDPLVQMRRDPPGDLAFVFTNNVDGEIEPCG